jgi:hypothetical protein
MLMDPESALEAELPRNRHPCRTRHTDTFSLSGRMMETDALACGNGSTKGMVMMKSCGMTRPNPFSSPIVLVKIHYVCILMGSIFFCGRIP